jgi:hypothetical protein
MRFVQFGLRESAGELEPSTIVLDGKRPKVIIRVKPHKDLVGTTVFSGVR